MGTEGKSDCKKKNENIVTGVQNHRRNNGKRESDFETVVDDIDGDIDSYIDDNDIPGETTTREKRKMRSATQILI